MPTTKKPANKVGRPTDYKPDLADEICELASMGESMRAIAKLDHMPDMRTIFRWLRLHEEFRQQYTRAKDEEMPEAMQERIHYIAEGTLDGTYDPNAARVAIDAYKWTASKLKPKKYGNTIDVTSDGKALPSPIIPLPSDTTS